MEIIFNKDEKVVKTDVNNVLLVQKFRESNPDVYMISADSKLIHWCKEIFVGQPSLVEFPSVWNRSKSSCRWLCNLWINGLG